MITHWRWTFRIVCAYERPRFASETSFFIAFPKHFQVSNLFISSFPPPHPLSLPILPRSSSCLSASQFDFSTNFNEFLPKRWKFFYFLVDSCLLSMLFFFPFFPFISKRPVSPHVLWFHTFCDVQYSSIMTVRTTTHIQTMLFSVSSTKPSFKSKWIWLVPVSTLANRSHCVNAEPIGFDGRFLFKINFSLFFLFFGMKIVLGNKIY